ncbi:hypothetical protein FTO70_14315 [Methanosarcina sp. KYL-1]|uniref:tubulin-like doman-containing protein n=1 Tax=Methanosarcina sp. KYL-1 TaxID=2602068 RepID=UPI0021012749|nr:tubulin-like doman-containing protein [Methanosarcina sp. KYL-1]MCQ1536824.1 hypothetical protein [Methanosarcina sp. KYL-1]
MNARESSYSALQLPTDLTIVGIGGCGKRLCREICNHDWILGNYLASGRRLRIYTMDTDANEKVEDEVQRSDIKARIQEIGARGNIEYKYYYLPALANINQVSDLASQEVAVKIKERKSDPMVKTWWLNDRGDSGLSFEELRTIDPFLIDDFGGGVHRRRAISKAIFYKVLSQGQASGFPTFPSIGTTAIIVGLGGGTGSGMFIDLARYIRALRGEATQIWLFAVIPTTKEGEKEQLNAAIALTELEYLNLNERLFNYVILTSLGPTGYKKGEEARVEVHEFDAMFPHILTNLFHIEKGDINLSDSKRLYSSFIFADAHVIEYPVEELKSLKKKFEEIILELENITASRKEINRAVKALLDNFNRFREMPPTRADSEFIKKEYGNVEKLWKNEIGKLLNYQSPEAVEFYIQNNISTDAGIEKITSYDSLLEFISKVKAFTISVKEDELKDENDRKLFRLIPEALLGVEDTAKLFKRVAGIEEEAARGVLINVLKGKQELVSSVDRLNAKSRALKEESLELRSVIESKQAEQDSLKQLNSRVERAVDKTLDDNDRDLEQYFIQKKKLKSIQENEQGLQAKIDFFISNLKTGNVKAGDKDSWLRLAGVPEIQREIDSLSHELEIDLQVLSRLMESIALYYYYEYRIDRVKKGGFKEKLVGAIKGDKKKVLRKFEAQKRSMEDYIKTSGKEYIQINAPFELFVRENFLSESQNKKSEELKNTILASVFPGMDEKDPAFDEIDQAFKSGDRPKLRSLFREVLTRNYLQKENYFGKLGAIEADFHALEESVEEKNTLSAMLEKLEGLTEETIVYRRDLNRQYDKFYDDVTKISDIKPSGSKTLSSLYLTKFGDINPKILSLIDASSDMKDLDWDESGKRELDKLIDEVLVTYKNLIESYKLGIHNLMIPISTTERWNFGKAALVVSSRSSYISSRIASEPIADTIKDEINGILALSNSNDAKLATHNHTKPWDIALTFFSSAGFLDNISPLTAGGGFWEIYENKKDNVLHHVLKLQEGKYVTRKALFDLKEAGELANLEKKGINVGARISELYEEKNIREALKKEDVLGDVLLKKKEVHLKNEGEGLKSEGSYSKNEWDAALENEAQDSENENVNLKNESINFENEDEDLKNEDEDLKNEDEDLKNEGESLKNEGENLKKERESLKKERESLKNEGENLNNEGRGFEK